jgi:uncharacterized protein YjbJ (UPF0337 family)
MSRLHEKAQGHTQQFVGQLIGDDRLVSEGKQQVSAADGDDADRHSDQGIVRDQKGEEQPKDKKRAQTVHTGGPDNSASRENTRDG